jgi:UDP-N-acetylglucosamine 4-epimerase
MIKGYGKTRRDFCYVATTVQVNLLGTTSQQADADHQIWNVAVGDRTELVRPFKEIRNLLAESSPERND